MPELLHYLYFLASDEEALGEAWRKLLVLYGLKEIDPDPVKYGPDVSRAASGSGGSMVLSVADHIAVLEVHLKNGSTDQLMSSRDLGRQELEEQIFDAVGESTFLINPDQDYQTTGKPLPSVDIPIGSITVIPEDGTTPRLYLFKSEDNEDIIRFIREKITALDCLSHELERQLEYNEDQQQSVVVKIDEMNRQIGQILNTRSKELEDLETEVDTISGIHAQLTSYNFLLGNMIHLLRKDVSRFDQLHAKAIGISDPFFHGRTGLKSEHLLNSLNTTQRELTRSLENTKSAMDVVKSRVDLNRSRASLDLQHRISSLMKQNVTIQEEMLVTGIAASMVEFFLVLYYGLGVWKVLAGEEVVHHIPLLLKGGLIALFSLSVVVGTHKTAKAFKERTKKGILIWGMVIIVLITVMTFVSVLFAHAH